jgi:hypothetical protein
MNWNLLDSATLNVKAEAEGVVIARRDAARQSSPSRLERVLPALLLQLEDMEIGAAQPDSSWLIPYPQFVQLESNGIDAFENLCQWSPFPPHLCKDVHRRDRDAHTSKLPHLR